MIEAPIPPGGAKLSIQSIMNQVSIVFDFLFERDARAFEEWLISASLDGRTIKLSFPKKEAKEKADPHDDLQFRQKDNSHE